jgi:hypothetical protein
MVPVSVYWSKTKGLIVIPARAKTEAGFWMDVEPVEVAPLHEQNLVTSAIKRVAFSPLITIPTPPRRDFPKPVVLRAGKVRSWSQFHWNYSLVQISGDNSETVSVEVWEKCAGGSYHPDSTLPAKTFPTLDKAIAAAIGEIQKPD